MAKPSYSGSSTPLGTVPYPPPAALNLSPAGNGGNGDWKEALDSERQYDADGVYLKGIAFGSNNVVDTGDANNAATNGLTTTRQPLTPFHSRMYSLLSWERPRTTAISFASAVVTIFAVRYLPLLRWALKLLYLGLGVTGILEVSSRAVFARGLTSNSRPRKYYTIPKDTVESVLEDIEQLVDFFLIEFQRVFYVENLPYTFGAFAASLISYWLVKFLPLWTVALLGVSTAYLGPLFYISNKEFVDEQIQTLQELIDVQTNQMKEMAGSQTSHATGVVKQYVNDYRAKAHEYVVSTRSRQGSPEVESTRPVDVKTEPEPEVAAPKPEPAIQHTDFPAAPKEEPVPEPVPEPAPELKKEEVNPDLISV